MSETYLLEGGPFDGEMVNTTGAHVLRMPVVRSMEVFRKVVPFRRGPDMEFVEYVRSGKVYRWDRLIGDAWSGMDVSEEAFAEGGSAVRAMVREQLRHALEELDPDKGLGRILWRVRYDRPTFRYEVRAFVGPRRVELAHRVHLGERE